MAIVYLNGDYVEAESAQVPVSDRGVLLGFGLFETLRAYRGIPFRLARHLDRLYRSAQELGFPLPAAREEIGRGVLEVIRRNGLEDARVRVTFTGGAAPEPGVPMGSALISAVPVEGLPPEIYTAGVRVISTSLVKDFSMARHKTTAAMIKVLAHQEAEAAGAFEAIFRNPGGRVSECATSNIFVAKGGGLKTPPLSEGILPGITREIVLSLAEGFDIPVEEVVLENEDLFRADEVFLTASVKEIVPVIQVGERTIGDGRPGPLAKRLHEAYRALAHKECAPPEDSSPPKGSASSKDAGTS